MPGVPNPLTFVVGSDHAGRHLRATVVEHLRKAGHTVDEVGPMEATSVDYPDVARPVAERVASGDAARAVLICGTGQGMAMTANKVRGVRAAVVNEPFSARMAALHNDARILCMGERVVGAGVALECLDAWLSSSFEGGRHARRVRKMEPVTGA